MCIRMADSFCYTVNSNNTVKQLNSCVCVCVCVCVCIAGISINDKEQSGLEKKPGKV